MEYLIPNFELGTPGREHEADASSRIRLLQGREDARSWDCLISRTFQHFLWIFQSTTARSCPCSRERIPEHPKEMEPVGAHPSNPKLHPRSSKLGWHIRSHPALGSWVFLDHGCPTAPGDNSAGASGCVPAGLLTFHQGKGQSPNPRGKTDPSTWNHRVWLDPRIPFVQGRAEFQQNPWKRSHSEGGGQS